MFPLPAFLSLLKQFSFHKKFMFEMIRNGFSFRPVTTLENVLEKTAKKNAKNITYCQQCMNIRAE